MVKKGLFITIIAALVAGFSFSFKNEGYYRDYYQSSLAQFDESLIAITKIIGRTNPGTAEGKALIKAEIDRARIQLKRIDIWLRYLEPVAYRRINGPLPVEWENEVFEKFEPPYKREGSGLSLAALYLDEDNVQK